MSGRIVHSVSSVDLNYDRATIEPMVVRIADDDWSLATTPYVDLGTSDNLALDQPQVTVELFEDAEATRSVGPTRPTPGYWTRVPIRHSLLRRR